MKDTISFPIRIYPYVGTWQSTVSNITWQRDNPTSAILAAVNYAKTCPLNKFAK